MLIIFRVISADGKKVRLTDEQLRHIARRHPEVAAPILLLEEVLVHPEFIREDSSADLRTYYKYLKDERMFIGVLVRVLNGDGFVVTAFLTRRVT